MSTTVGPLIDSQAFSRVQSYIRAAPEQGKVVLARADVPSNGFHAGPTIVTELDRLHRSCARKYSGRCYVCLERALLTKR